MQKYRTPLLTIDPNATAGGGLVEVYLASEADARIAELEKVLAEIAAMGNEENEWDAVDRYHKCMQMAAAAFSRPVS